MKKILVLLLAAVMLVGLVACAGDQNSTTEPPTTTKGEENDESKLGTLELIEKKLSEGMDKGYAAATEITKDELKDVYGLDTEKITSFVAKKGAKFEDLVILLEVKKGTNDDAVASLNKYLTSLNTEDAELSEKVLGARLFSADNYVLLIITGEEYAGTDKEAEKKLADTEYAKVDTIIKGVMGESQTNLADFAVKAENPDNDQNTDNTEGENNDNTENGETEDNTENGENEDNGENEENTDDNTTER